MSRKLLLAPFLTLFIYYSGSCQEIIDQNTVQGLSGDYLFHIIPTSDGGYISCGASRSPAGGDKFENNIGGINDQDYWIVKVDSLLNIQWENTIGGGEDEAANCIRQTSDGGYIIAGSSESGAGGDKTEYNVAGSVDYWVIKIDAFGIIEWQNNIGGNESESLLFADQAPDGTYFLAGSTLSGISGDKTDTLTGWNDYWIIKLDSAGNIMWQNAIGGTGPDLLGFAQITADGGLICGGTSGSPVSGDKADSCRGAYDFWIVKLDDAGNIQWQKTIGGSGYDYLYSITTTDDGGYICGGKSLSNISGEKTENCIGDYDVYVVKLDSVGNILWQNTIGGTALDEVRYIEQTDDGGYFLGCMSHSGISGDKTEENLGDWDNWLIKLDAGGTLEWQNTIGGTESDLLYSASKLSSGDFIIGSSSGSPISPDKDENAMGSSDYWIYKFSALSNIVSGKLFADLNADNIHDSGESMLPYRLISENNTGRYTFSKSNGSYRLTIPDTGSFTVLPPQVNYYTPSPSSHSTYFNSMLLEDSLTDFGFQPGSPVNDLGIVMTPMNVFRAGFDVKFKVHYSNAGTVPLTPEIVYYLSPITDFVSSSITPAIVTNDSIVWNLPQLQPMQWGEFDFIINISQFTTIGTITTSSIQINPVSGDINPASNISSWRSAVSSSFDPNDISVNEDTLLNSQFPNPPYLDYLIRFQNTGNDTAFYVEIRNPLSGNLDLSTIEIIDVSHPCTPQHNSQDNIMQFIFQNILLPDSNINEPESHGFVRYRIKPVNNLIAGDSILNSAGIIFDFNTPVITNTAVTEVVNPVYVPEHEELDFQVYPVPVTDILQVQFAFRESKSVIIQLFDIYGRKIMDLYSGKISQGRSINNFQLKNLSNGLYVISISGDITGTKKILKIN